MKKSTLWGWIVCTLLIGCSGPESTTQSIPSLGEPAAFLIRVQSSYGDIQQVEVSVKEWSLDSRDVRVFDKKMTPFDIPVAAGEFSVRLACPPGSPKIKLQLIRDDGQMAGYVQSNEVCARVNANGKFEIEECMAGLR